MKRNFKTVTIPKNMIGMVETKKAILCTYPINKSIKFWIPKNCVFLKDINCIKCSIDQSDYYWLWKYDQKIKRFIKINKVTGNHLITIINDSNKVKNNEEEQIIQKTIFNN